MDEKEYKIKIDLSKRLLEKINKSIIEERKIVKERDLLVNEYSKIDVEQEHMFNFIFPDNNKSSNVEKKKEIYNTIKQLTDEITDICRKRIIVRSELKIVSNETIIYMRDQKMKQIIDCKCPGWDKL